VNVDVETTLDFFELVFRAVADPDPVMVADPVCPEPVRVFAGPPPVIKSPVYVALYDDWRAITLDGTGAIVKL
jgi:hypothetical protein